MDTRLVRQCKQDQPDSAKPDNTTRQIDREITWRVDRTERPIGDAGPTGGLTIS